MFKWAQRIARILIVLVTGSFLLFALLTAWYIFGFHKADRLTQPELAFWMQHQWMTEEAPSFTELATRLDELPPSTLYFHVGPIEADGSLADDLSIQPSRLNALPSINYAWIGQIRSEISLDDPAIRAQIVSSAEWLMSQGFDGIHVNIEPVRPDDAAFPLLMQELDAALPEALISVSMDEWQPDALTQWVAHWFDTNIVSYWTSQQVLDLRPYVDEFVVMTYDSGFRDPDFYSWWVEQQTVALSQLMDSGTRLMIGLPVYEEGASFDPNAENLQTGLVGYTRGVSNLRSVPEVIGGVALYSFWEMDENEWDILNSYLSNEIDLP